MMRQYPFFFIFYLPIIILFSHVTPVRAVAPEQINFVSGSQSSNGTSFTMTWSTPTLRADGTALSPGEIVRYIVYRRELIGGATNQTFTVTTPTQTSLTDSSLLNRLMYYNIVAVNNLSEESASSNFLVSAGEIAILMDDNLSFIQAPQAVITNLRAQGLEVRGRRDSSDEQGKIFKSVTVEVYDETSGEVQSNYIFDQSVQVSLGYIINSQDVVESGSRQLPFAASAPTSSEAQSALSSFWFNGSDWLKIQSSVNTTQQVVTTRSRHSGNFQVRLVQQNLEAELNSTFPSTITPNGDGINDIVFFLFENPTGGPIQGRLFDTQSAFIADADKRDLFSGETVLSWDGKDNDGSLVAGGIYFYKMEAGGKTFTGTVAVAR